MLFATGYDYAIPYVDEALFTWTAGRPDLYLNVLHRSLDGLYVLGFVEFADAAYQRFDEMAQLVVIDAYAHATGTRARGAAGLRAPTGPTCAAATTTSTRHGTRPTWSRGPTSATSPRSGTGSASPTPTTRSTRRTRWTYAQSRLITSPASPRLPPTRG